MLDDRVRVVDRPREHAPELRVADAALERRHLRSRLREGRLVVLGRAELEEHAGVVDVARQLLDAGELLLEARALAR